MDNPDGAPMRPEFPQRYRRFMDALGQVSVIVDGKVKDPGPSKAPPKRPVRDRSAVLDHRGRPIEA